MKNILLILIAGILSFSSCVRKDGYTISQFILKNDSGVDVKILPTNFMLDTLLLTNNTVHIDKEAPMGKGKSEGIFYAQFPDFINPVIVIFNEIDTVKHFNDSLFHKGNYYNLTSSRCFYNKKSYNKEIRSISKYSNDVILRYTFTEQDYLDAQK